MKATVKIDTSSVTSSASVVDGKLILSLPDAATPVVWQMDLEQARSSALEVREDTKTGKFMLALKTQKGETVNVASYEDKSSAVQALMVTSKALENAHGKIRPGANAAAAEQQNAQNARFSASGAVKPGEENSSKASAVLAVLLILILISAWAYSIPKAKNSIEKMRSTSGSSAPPSDTGVPVSADDFLSRRQ